jgi:hypothetical protein
VARLLASGKAVAAELPASRPAHRAFIRANKLPRGGFAVVRFEMSDKAIAELEDRWDTNEDYLDKESETVADLSEIDDVLKRWGLDPDVLQPAWQVDFP